MSFFRFNKIILSFVKKGKWDAINSYPYYSEWIKRLGPGHSSLKDELPWLTFAAIDFIKKNISRDHVVFEYGGGGSTLFFLKNSAKVVTVEHDKSWFEKLKGIVKHKKIEHWEGNFIHPEIDQYPNKKDISDPNDYASDDGNYKNVNFKKYVTAIEKYPDNHFDWILIDGRARTSCLAHSIPKLKIGGYLILDNAERKYYTETQKETINTNFDLLINTFGAIPFVEDFSQTNIWKKRS